MKTIKVIDLLNKIANEEELPKKIKYQGNNFKYEEYCKDYKCISDEEYGFLLKDDIGDNYCYPLLNHEVEIIEDAEEDKEIKPLTKTRVIFNAKENENMLFQFCCDLERKQKEIIEVINKLNKKD